MRKEVVSVTYKMSMSPREWRTLRNGDDKGSIVTGRLRDVGCSDIDWGPYEGYCLYFTADSIPVAKEGLDIVYELVD